MKVKVTRQDIEDGRNSAGLTCGCPIHHALGRKLKVRINPYISTENVLLVPSYYKAKLGRITIPLPNEVVEFQKKLTADPTANVKPFEFETKLVVPE